MTTIKNEQNEHNKFNKEQINQDRTQAFEKFSNKIHISKALSFTKPCSNVIKKKANGEFGVCYRAECSYAHSKDELKPPKCNFDITCKFRDGKKTLQGVIPNTECNFLHSDETPEEWMERTKDKKDKNTIELPETSEFSRKPVIKEDKSIIIKENKENKDDIFIIKINESEDYQESLKIAITNALKNKKFNLKIEFKDSEVN